MKIRNEIFPKNDLIYLFLLIIGFLGFDCFILFLYNFSFEEIMYEASLLVYVGGALHLALIVCIIIFIYKLFAGKEHFSVDFLDDNIEFKFSDTQKDFSISYQELKLLDIDVKAYKFVRTYSKFLVPGKIVYIPYEMDMALILNDGRTFKLHRSFNMFWTGYYKFFLEFNKYLNKTNHSLKAYDGSGNLLPDLINNTRDEKYLKRQMMIYN